MLKVIHTLSVSLNKIGDLKYYDGDLQTARSFYSRALDVRRNACKVHPAVASQVNPPTLSLFLSLSFKYLHSCLLIVAIVRKMMKTIKLENVIGWHMYGGLKEEVCYIESDVLN